MCIVHIGPVTLLFSVWWCSCVMVYTEKELTCCIQTKHKHTCRVLRPIAKGTCELGHHATHLWSCSGPSLTSLGTVSLSTS